MPTCTTSQHPPFIQHYQIPSSMAAHVRPPSPTQSSLYYFLCPTHLRRGWRQYRYITRYLFVFALSCSLVLTLCLHLQFEHAPSEPRAPPIRHDSHAYPPLHLFIPVNQPGLLFCKSLASAIINTYPPPILINFNTTYAKPKLAHGAKLAGMAEYLRVPPKTGPGIGKKPAGNWETDLVLFADGFDIWYQLPADVLIRRYAHFHTNVKGSGWTSGTPAPAPIIFGADKQCWPNTSDSPPCKLAPESTLPNDAYGADTTDKVIGDSGYKKFRPRYLNAGTVFGEWGSMMEVYSKAAKKAADRMRAGEEVLSDQGVLADVWGEDLVLDELNKQKPATGGEGSVRGMGMVMDYESRLYQTMTHSHDDVKWNMVNTTPTAGDRDMDLSSNLYPAPLPPVLQLATNLVSNTIAALVHFNGPKFPLGSEDKPGWWGRMWWFNLFPEVTDVKGKGRTAKMFFERHIERVRSAGAGVASAGLGQVGGVWTDQGEWMEWEEICGKWDFVGTGGVWGI